jgi:predicted TIM-barrel fold metal-dependent hydrolase
MGQLPLIDADAHITEPVDLWEAAAPASKRKDVPHYERDAEGRVAMYIGADRVSKPRLVSESEYYSGEERTIVNDVTLRVAYMDKVGFWAQILYPGVAGTVLGRLLSIKDLDTQAFCVQTYNDWLADWARPSGGRLVPVGLLPLLDLDAAVAEVGRAVSIGHRSVLFPHRPQEMGLPLLVDKAWDPLWAVCAEAGVPVAFHGGFGDDLDRKRLYNPEWREFGFAGAASIGSITAFLDNVDVLLQLMFSGILQRFPTLRIASAESGIGYVAYLMEAADWHFHATDMHTERPDLELLPSEYLRRQVYLTYWFERSAPERMLDVIGPERVMFETDFPHRTSLYGQSQTTGRPLDEIVNERVECLAPDYRELVVWRNAAQLYGIKLAEDRAG